MKRKLFLLIAFLLLQLVIKTGLRKWYFVKTSKNEERTKHSEIQVTLTFKIFCDFFFSVVFNHHKLQYFSCECSVLICVSYCMQDFWALSEVIKRLSI